MAEFTESEVSLGDLLGLLMMQSPFWLSVAGIKLAIVTKFGLACVSGVSRIGTIRADGARNLTATCWIDLPDGATFSVLTDENSEGAERTDFLAFMAHRTEVLGPVRANELGPGEHLTFADPGVNTLFSGTGPAYQIQRKEGGLNAIGVIITRTSIDRQGPMDTLKFIFRYGKPEEAGRLPVLHNRIDEGGAVPSASEGPTKHARGQDYGAS